MEERIQKLEEELQALMQEAETQKQENAYVSHVLKGIASRLGVSLWSLEYDGQPRIPTVPPRIEH